MSGDEPQSAFNPALGQHLCNEERRQEKHTIRIWTYQACLGNLEPHGCTVRLILVAAYATISSGV